MGDLFTDDTIQLDDSKPAGKPAVGDQVKTYAYNKKGQQEGNGECFTLADNALKDSGAKSAADFGVVTADADYVWGTSVDTLLNAQPGDIIQFRNFTVTTTTTVTTVTTVTKADGSSSEQTDTQTSTQTASRPHHTAIIWSKGAKGALTALEQNVDPGGKKVQVNDYTFSDSDTSTDEVLQPDSQTTIKKNTKVSIKVTGTKKIYRPVKK
jgi:hypothetical protein